MEVGGGGESGLSGEENQLDWNTAVKVASVIATDEERLTQYKRVEKLLYQYALGGGETGAYGDYFANMMGGAPAMKQITPDEMPDRDEIVAYHRDYLAPRSVDR